MADDDSAEEEDVTPIAAGALLFLLSGGAAAPACPPQPMPPAIESAGEPAPHSHLIAFAATPWEHPGRAWVVRVSRRGRSEARLEIVRLLRRSDCNLWGVEKRWQAAIGPDEYRSLAEAVAPWGIPPADLVPGSPPHRPGGEPVLDGTGLELSFRKPGWRVTRTLNHYGRGGADLSALFRALVARHVPAGELPAEDWRTRRAR